ncbi:hypothetical protein D3C87_2129660 [compost metagenome]
MSSQPTSSSTPETAEVTTLGFFQGLGCSGATRPSWGGKPNSRNFSLSDSEDVEAESKVIATFADLG